MTTRNISSMKHQGFFCESKKSVIKVTRTNIKPYGRRGFSTSTDNKLTILELRYKGQLLSIERTEDWYINMTQVAKLFNKRWRDWAKRNATVINKFELLEGKSLTREVGPKNKVQTHVSIKLALRALSDYDDTFSWHVFTEYEKSFEFDKSKLLLDLHNIYKRVELLTAENSKLKNKAIDVDLVGGQFLLYAYMCNNQVKFGTSFCNKNGQRPKSHKTSVPNLAIGFVIYASKEHLTNVNKRIKEKFSIGGRFEHVNCTIDELEEFVTQYLELMAFQYKKEDIQKLDLLNIFLKS